MPARTTGAGPCRVSATPRLACWWWAWHPPPTEPTAPGACFTGDRSGEWLYRALWRAGFANQPQATHAGDGLRLSGAWVTSPVKCAPPANKPTAEEFAACRGFFEAEFAALAHVRVVMALGGLACGAVARHWNLRPRPRFAHGLEVPLPGGRTLLCCYHVSQQNTFTGPADRRDARRRLRPGPLPRRVACAGHG